MTKHILLSSTLTIATNGCMGMDLYYTGSSSSSSSSSPTNTGMPTSTDNTATTHLTESASGKDVAADDTTTSLVSEATTTLAESTEDSAPSSTGGSSGGQPPLDIPPCGNGLLDQGEECDTLKSPSACESCTKKGRLAFISSEEFPLGNIKFLDWQASGVEDDQTEEPITGYTNRLDDADMFCWQLAYEALEKNENSEFHWKVPSPEAHFRPFKAWLSDNSGSPSDTYKGFTACTEETPFILHDGTVIANTFSDLTAKGPLSPINIDEQGNKILHNQKVWTGTNQMGQAIDPLADCHNWNGPNTPEDKIQGWRGIALKDAPDALDETWTKHTASQCRETNTARLYCFEQCNSPA